MQAVSKGLIEMREITVKKFDLLKTVIENRQKHIAVYNAAIVGYKAAMKVRLVEKAEEAIAEIQSNLEKFLGRVDGLKLPTSVILQNVSSVTLKIPESHEKDYDVVIEMLRWCVTETIDIRTDVFQCYVMDDWDWKEEFVATTSSYGAR